MSNTTRHYQTFAHLGVARASIYTAPAGAFTIIDEPGHYLHDPHSPTEAPAWLVDSIREDGVQVPIRVKRVGEALCVVDGRTRVRAALAVGADTIVRYILDDGTEEDAERAKEIGNNLRRIVGPATKAELIAKYRRRGFPDGKIAALIAEPVSALEPMLAVNDCSAWVRSLMEAGRLDWRLAERLAKMTAAEQKDKVTEMFDGGRRRFAKRRPTGRATPRVLAALSDLPGLDEMVAAAIRYAAGDRAPMRALRPKMAEAMDAAWLAASRPGRRT